MVFCLRKRYISFSLCVGFSWIFCEKMERKTMIRILLLACHRGQTNSKAIEGKLCIAWSIFSGKIVLLREPRQVVVVVTCTMVAGPEARERYRDQVSRSEIVGVCDWISLTMLQPMYWNRLKRKNHAKVNGEIPWKWSAACNVPLYRFDLVIYRRAQLTLPS